MSLSTRGVHEFCREKFKLVQSFSCPSSRQYGILLSEIKFNPEWFNNNEIH